MSGAIPLFPLCAFMESRRITTHFLYAFHRKAGEKLHSIKFFQYYTTTVKYGQVSHTKHYLPQDAAQKQVLYEVTGNSTFTNSNRWGTQFHLCAYLVSKMYRPALGPTQATSQRIWPLVPGCYNDHSLLSSTQVRNE